MYLLPPKRKDRQRVSALVDNKKLYNIRPRTDNQPCLRVFEGHGPIDGTSI